MGIYTRQSRAPRVKPEGDRGKKMILSLPGFFFFFVIPRLDRGICKGDVRLKAEHDKKQSPSSEGLLLICFLCRPVWLWLSSPPVS